MSINGPDKYERISTDWGPSLTKQSEEPKCNINNIVKLYTKTGELTHVSTALASYRDVSGIPDLQEAMLLVANAQSAFEELPAHIRKAVGHDVGKFLPWLDNPDNLDEAIDLGLIPESARESNTVPTPPPVAEITPTEVPPED